MPEGKKGYQRNTATSAVDHASADHETIRRGKVVGHWLNEDYNVNSDHAGLVIELCLSKPEGCQ